MAVCVLKRRRIASNKITQYMMNHFCAIAECEEQSIRIRRHNLTSDKKQMSVNYRGGTIPSPIMEDLINLESEVAESSDTIPPQIDRETVRSWISTIIRSTQCGDIRAVKLIHGTVESLSLSFVYFPIYHALIFGYGKLGDIDSMLNLYHFLKQQSQTQISASLMATILSGLAMHNRSLEAAEIFDDFLSNGNAPNIDCFAMMLKICAFAKDWSLCRFYFTAMVREHNIFPNALCFKYLLSATAYCRPPKYEEALSILHEMANEWKIQPNTAHFAAVIHCLSTKHNLIKNDQLFETEQIAKSKKFAKYKFALLHNRLFEESVLSEADLQRILDLFERMIEEYAVTPNDKVFGELFYAMANAKNLEIALKFLRFWRSEYPQVRQQSFSFKKLLSICSSIKSWDDAMTVYRQIALDDAQSIDSDQISHFFHKVQPEISCFNQLLRCNKLDISRQIYSNALSQSEAEELCLKRIEFVQSQMYNFKYSPSEFSWLLLFRTAAMIQSKNLCDRFLKKYFLFSLKTKHKSKAIRSFMNWGNDRSHFAKLGDSEIACSDSENFSDCWNYFDLSTFDCSFSVFLAILNALYWTNQIEEALRFYHFYYFERKKFTHWHIGDDCEHLKDSCVDFHEFDAASSSIAFLYILHNEMDAVYRSNDRIVIGSKMENNVKLTKTQSANTLPSIRIICGKGAGNALGKSVLRPWISLWLQNELNPPIKSYVHPRNVGVLVLDSNDIRKYLDVNKQKHKKYHF